jgi:hypothetical protein
VQHLRFVEVSIVVCGRAELLVLMIAACCNDGGKYGQYVAHKEKRLEITDVAKWISGDVTCCLSYPTLKGRSTYFMSWGWATSLFFKMRDFSLLQVQIRFHFWFAGCSIKLARKSTSQLCLK